jgi:hypothetical protein
LNVREQIAGMFRLQGNGEMSIGELIFAARYMIASAVADLALFALEQKFEGKQTGDTQSQIGQENGEIVSYTRTDAPKKADRPQPSVPSPSRRYH